MTYKKRQGYFTAKPRPGENVGKLFYREGIKRLKSSCCLTRTSYIGGEMLSLQNAQPSYDGKKIAISYSKQALKYLFEIYGCRHKAILKGFHLSKSFWWQLDI
jgi:hypothetical protein